jgi:flavin-dependent dehydrogenase
MARPLTIAGAGLSGLATAVLLAGRGVPCVAYDRRRGGGGRFHGGWQVLENGSTELDALRELESLGMPLDFETLPARKAVFLDGLGGSHEIGSSEPFAYFIVRGAGPGTLDGALRRRAAGLGVELREGSAAPSDVDVIATGPRQADGVARELVFASDLEDTVAVLFDPRVTPTGYAYLFCLGGHATFGVAQVRRVAGLREAGREAWRRFRERFGEFAVREPREGGQYMNFALPASLRDGGGRWYVGEAAGVQDFLFGLGNRLALRSAALAAEGVAGGFDAAAFEERIRRPMRHSIAARAAYERLGRRAFAAVCRTASRRDFREVLLAAQRPNAVSLALARAAAAVWRERRGCRHAPVCAWCRRRES